MWVLKWKEQIVHSQTKSGGPYTSSGVALKILCSYYISQSHNKLSFNISGHTSVDILADSLTVPTNFVPSAMLRRTEVNIKYLNSTNTLLTSVFQYYLCACAPDCVYLSGVFVVCLAKVSAHMAWRRMISG